MNSAAVANAATHAAQLRRGEGGVSNKQVPCPSVSDPYLIEGYLTRHPSHDPTQKRARRKIRDARSPQSLTANRNFALRLRRFCFTSAAAGSRGFLVTSSRSPRRAPARRRAFT